jgi:hypothetical protein
MNSMGGLDGFGENDLEQELEELFYEESDTVKVRVFSWVPMLGVPMSGFLTSTHSKWIPCRKYPQDRRHCRDRMLHYIRCPCWTRHPYVAN